MEREFSCFCITLDRAATSLTDFYNQSLAELGITVKQYSLLSKLHSLGSCSTSELAEAVGLDRSTLVRNLKVLMQRGWIEDSASRTSRAHAYTLTQEGLEVREKAKACWERLQEQVVEKVGSEKMAVFFEVLGELQSLEQENFHQESV